MAGTVVSPGTAGSAVIAGIGSSLPTRAVGNDVLARQLGTTEVSIRRLTGIENRYWIEPGQGTSDLAVEAGSRAIDSAGGQAPQAVVVATTTPDRPCPATAPAVASRLGLQGAAAFDIGAGCSGFLYGLAAGAGLLAAGFAEQVLVIGADTISTLLDPTDRSTGVIFGDGAGAVVLRSGQSSEPGAVQVLDLGSDGSGADMITVPAGGSRQRSTKSAAPAAEAYLKMARPGGVPRVGDPHGRLLPVRPEPDRLDRGRRRPAGPAPGEPAHHARRRGPAGPGPRPRRRRSGQVGNTSAASIPLALAHAAADGTVRPGHRLLLTAFGSGLTWGAATLVWPDVKPV